MTSWAIQTFTDQANSLTKGDWIINNLISCIADLVLQDQGYPLRLDEALAKFIRNHR